MNLTNPNKSKSTETQRLWDLTIRPDCPSALQWHVWYSVGFSLRCELSLKKPNRTDSWKKNLAFGFFLTFSSFFFPWSTGKTIAWVVKLKLWEKLRFDFLKTFVAFSSHVFAKRLRGLFKAQATQNLDWKDVTSGQYKWSLARASFEIKSFLAVVTARILLTQCMNIRWFLNDSK